MAQLREDDFERQLGQARNRMAELEAQLAEVREARVVERRSFIWQGSPDRLNDALIAGQRFSGLEQRRVPFHALAMEVPQFREGTQLHGYIQT